MAQIIEEIVVIKFSRLVKGDGSLPEIVSAELQASLEQVAEELVGSGVIVEVTKA